MSNKEFIKSVRCTTAYKQLVSNKIAIHNDGKPRYKNKVRFRSKQPSKTTKSQRRKTNMKK